MRPQYPIATSANEAMGAFVKVAPTLAQARNTIQSEDIHDLSVEIIQLSPPELKDALSQLENSPGQLFYEILDLIPEPPPKYKASTDAPIPKRETSPQALAIRYWKIDDANQHAHEQISPDNRVTINDTQQLALWPE